MKHNKTLGTYGEQIAGKFLEQKGYTILEMQYSAHGCEVDVIAQKGDLIAFVEVKSRIGSGYGQPVESVNVAKQKRIITAAEQFLMDYPEADVRFDVVEIMATQAGEEYAIKRVNHIENAFWA